MATLSIFDAPSLCRNRRETESLSGKAGLVSGLAARHPVALGAQIFEQPHEVRFLLFEPGDLRVDDLHLAIRRQTFVEEFAGNVGDFLERHAQRLRETDHQGGRNIPLIEDLIRIAPATGAYLWCQQAFADVKTYRVLAETRPRGKLSNQHRNHP